MACNDQRNPLQHDGSSQEQRRLPALAPGYARVDERSVKDWIDFAGRFSVYLNYYSSDDVAAGNWEAFFNNDLSAVLGSLAVQDIDGYRQAVQERLAALRDDANDNDLPGMEATLGSLFSAVLTLALGLDGYTAILAPTHRTYILLQQLISQRLRPALRQLMIWHKGGRSDRRSDGTLDNALVIIRDKDVPDWTVLRQPVLAASSLISTRSLSSAWLDGAASLTSWYEALPAENGIYGDQSASPVYRIRHAANHNLFTGALDQFLGAYAGVIRDAEAALEESLESYNLHPPHYTLFLTFLRLFRLAQDELNTLGERHLRHYYEDILRLRPKPAQPKSVYLVAELNKGLTRGFLPKNTAFRAGKDDTGKEMLYRLSEDSVFSAARIESLMAVYRASGKPGNGKPGPDNLPGVNNEGRLFASPVMNSADGLGKVLLTPAGEWHPFVNKRFSDGQLSAIDMPKAATGIAIASPYLWMAEGDREIRLQIETSNLPTSFPATLHFDAAITTAKGWTTVDMQCTVTQNAKGVADAINLRVLLDGGFPAITPFDRNVHAGNYRGSTPILRLLLRNSNDTPYEYDLLRELRLASVTLSVFAGIDPENGQATRTGLRNLLLANDLGPVDAAKPFNPFGLMPGKGSAFTIGSEEFFKKPGAEFQLKLNWLDLPSAATDLDYDSGSEGDKAPAVRLEVLARSAWQEISDDLEFWELAKGRGRRSRGPGKATKVMASNRFLTANTFPKEPTSLGIGNNGQDYAAYPDFAAAYQHFNPATRDGFLRVVLEAGFGYTDYQKAFARYLIEMSRGGGTDPGNAPYVPKLESISLHYRASVRLEPDDKPGTATPGLEFYHVYPFGTVRQAPENQPQVPVMLVPQYVRGSGSMAARDSGEFYIGLSGLQPLQGLDLLFAVQEGSADPLLVKPEAHLDWSYLSRNTWKPFPARAVNDTTAQWIRTGIISFSIPDDADLQHDILPAGQIWIRASASSATGAVCKLIGIHPNAALARFSDTGNASGAMAQPVPAGSITKLREPVAAFRKFLQPYDAFGGASAEAPAAYQSRVSERLRHRDRAITIWDYEHLVLEAFPGLHRVKCLSHTSFKQLADGSRQINEMAPGHVTLITVPQLSGAPTSNPLRPYTSERMLEEIRAFLKPRLSAHVQLHVVHPIFEEIALDFRLRLMPEFDDFVFYRNRLSEEITSWLTPWATGAGSGPAFGGRVSKAALINFIEERHYVDYITDVRLYHRTEAAPVSVSDTDEIRPATALSILVSVPASRHVIVEIPRPAASNAAVACIDPYQPVTKA